MSDDEGDFALRCVWTGAALVPRGTSLSQAGELWGEGEFITVTGGLERSLRSHRHYFAMIREYWLNIHEDLHAMPYAQTPEAFRKHALIATGYCDVQTTNVGTVAGAERVAAMMRNLPGEYRVVSVVGAGVQVLSPHSQRMRAMGKKTFQKSKEDVLGWCENLVTGNAK